MDKFSVIMPCEKSRLPLLIKSLMKYAEDAIEANLSLEFVEFIIPTRTMTTDDIFKYFVDNILNSDDDACIPLHIKAIPYVWDGKYFSSSKPLNLGVHNATYENIIITCPEVKPLTNVLKQLSELPRGNYVCQVFDEDDTGNTGFSLVNTGFRSDSPAMYFLALFKREDIYDINGWDEDFMGTYAYEDNDFGARFNRAGLKFEMRDEIQALHQYHVRGTQGQDGGASLRLFFENNVKGVIKPKNGLIKL